MPFKYVRKTGRGSWSPEDMSKAVMACRRGEMSIRLAAKTYNVPKSTLSDQVKLNAGDANDFTAKPPSLGRKPTLKTENEAELERLILEMESRGFGLSKTDVCRIAFEFAESNSIEHDFNKESQTAGRFWMAGFLKRHPRIVPRIVPRKAEGLSKARAIGMNKEVVQQYFDRLGAVLDREGFHQSPEKIYNVDESGMPMINRPGTVLAQKGKRSVVTVTNAKRGENVTAVACCNAAGQFIPPMIIMKGKRKKDEFTDGLPPGSELGMSDSSYINKDLFLQWLQMFRKHAVPGKVLLIIDGHTSHVKSVAVLEYCIANDVILVCLPGHTTKYLQPLDRSVFKSLKSNWHIATNLYMRQNPGGNITKYRFGPLFAAAWGKSASVSNATSGFRACGIHAFNPEAIPNDAFAPSETTERELAALIPPIQEQTTNAPSDVEDMDIDEDSEDGFVDAGALDAQPDALPQSGTQDLPQSILAQVAPIGIPAQDQPSCSTSTSSRKSFVNIQPLPKVDRPQTASKRRKQQWGS